MLKHLPFCCVCCAASHYNVLYIITLYTYTYIYIYACFNHIWTKIYIVNCRKFYNILGNSVHGIMVELAALCSSQIPYHFIQPKDSSLCLQELALNPCPDPTVSCSCCNYLRSISILFSVHLDLPRNLLGLTNQYCMHFWTYLCVLFAPPSSLNDTNILKFWA